MLLEMKNKAELMVDLAYSSVIYDNIELAEEVYELEDMVDELNDRLQKLVIRDAIAGELEENEALAIIQLAYCAEAIADAAREIADVELRDIELHPIIKESIFESEEVLVKAKVSSSVLCDKKLGDVDLASNTGMWIIAIKRNGEWIYNVNKDTVIKEGDILFARGAREGVEHFLSLVEGREKNI
ncbi:MAG: PhoU family transcriptional regulator [Thermoplasmatales archaeon]|nr:PhoU family transcriptional regulator [Thermoplasmatales archaeon]